ncbi:MAG: hypothetical protein U0U69_15075 [Acidimicrobiia bacterium]
MIGAVEKTRPGITLATVEVEVLCRLLDCGLPRGIPARLDTHAVREAAVACLAARGLLGCGRPGGSGIEVHDAVARTLRLAARCRTVVARSGETMAVGDAASIFVRYGDLGVVRFEPIANP